MLFAYFIEGHPEFGARVKQIIESITQRRDVLCTSVFTIGEVLTGPEKAGNQDLVRLIRDLIRPPHVELLPFDVTAAARYARIRANHKVTPPDAIHLATAAESQVNLFLTNDQKLKKFIIPGIDFIAGLDVNLY
jgi:predicted nucleic acid-binding protein